MTPDEFRRWGREVVDWIADYQERVESFPVLSRATGGELRARLPVGPPADGEPFDAILRDLDELILPGVTHWQSPNFFAFFPANNSGPSILGELVSAGLSVQGMTWATSPACTELESHVLDWLVDMLALPERFKSTAAGGGVIQDSASSATLCALIAARERTTGFDSNRRGIQTKLTVYASREAHSSVEKAAMIAGLGRENLRPVDVDRQFAMRPDALDEAIAADRAAGAVPAFVCATVGTTSSHGLDPLAAIGQICRRHGVWLHVDAAMCGTAAICPEFRHIHRGLELADSYCFNPHKWMFVNFDCDAFFVADRQALTEALSIMPEYLKNPAAENAAPENSDVIDYRNWQIPLGRRFRALKLWFVIRSFGVEGLRARIREHVSLAREFASWVDAHDDFELAAEVPLNLICFRHRDGDDVNARLLEHVNASGKLYLTHTRLNDRFTLRMSIGQTTTARRHVDAAWREICSAATEVAT